jgi:hypothetical protein
MDQSISLHIVLETPPAGVDYGLQKGSGSKFEIVQKQRSAGKYLQFTFTVGLKQGKDGQPDFSGPFVQGPAGGRFVYIGIGTFAEQADSVWSRRLKIPLQGITREMVQQAAEADRLLETHVPGTGKDGTPSCATVKPFEGWRVTIKHIV